MGLSTMPEINGLDWIDLGDGQNNNEEIEFLDQCAAEVEERLEKSFTNEFDITRS